MRDASLNLMLPDHLFLPPTALLLPLLVALGLAVWQRRRRLWSRLALLIAAALYVTSLPLVSEGLLWAIQLGPPLTPEMAQQRMRMIPESQAAIVVLSAGADAYAPQYGAASPDPLTAGRLHYGIYLARLTGLPVLVSGGVIGRNQPALGLTMSEVMQRDYALIPRWIEGRSRNTKENASFSAEMLEASGVTHVILVTHAWHLRRSAAQFERHGLKVIPAGIEYVRFDEGLRARHFLPNSLAWRESYFAFHEILGGIWYAIWHR